jgi:hypothetical protein
MHRNAEQSEQECRSMRGGVTAMEIVVVWVIAFLEERGSKETGGSANACGRM